MSAKRRPRWIDRDPAHRNRDRQRSGAKQRHDPERARAERAVEWTRRQCHYGGHRTDRDAAVYRLSCRSQGRRDNHRQHLHAGEMQQGECQSMQRLHKGHGREPSGDSGDAPAHDPCAGSQRGRARWPKPPQQRRAYHDENDHLGQDPL